MHAHSSYVQKSSLATFFVVYYDIIKPENSRKKTPKMLLLKIKKPLLRYIKTSALVIIAGLIYSLGGVVRLDMEAKQNIQNFISRAEETPSYEQNINGYTFEYYTVSRETFELEDDRNVFHDNEKTKLGQTGDIIVTQQSPFPNIPIIHQWITFYFGGHASLVNENNKLYEATGIGSSNIFEVMLFPGNKTHDFDISVTESNNYWLNTNRRSESSSAYPYYGSFNRNEFLVLRVKDVTETQRLDAVRYAKNLYEKEALYNYTFFLDVQYKYYCTDMISRAYQDVMVPTQRQRGYAQALNDRFITSVNDLINSKDTYITSYISIKDTTVSIYYLEDIEEG